MKQISFILSALAWAAKVSNAFTRSNTSLLVSSYNTISCDSIASCSFVAHKSNSSGKNTVTKNNLTILHGKRKRFFDLFKSKRRKEITPKEPLKKEQVRDLFQKWNDALATGDSSLVADSYSTDAILTATSSNELKSDNESIKAYFDRVVKRDPTVSIIEGTIKTGQNWAMDVGIYEWTFGDDMSRKRARYSFVYTPNEDDEWKIRHHHSSAMPEG